MALTDSAMVPALYSLLSVSSAAKAPAPKKSTLEEALSLCSAIKVPSTTIPTVRPPLRRSQRLLGIPPPPAPATPVSTRRCSAKPAALAAKKGSSRVQKRTSAPCKECKGKAIAAAAPPVQIRLELTKKISFIGENGVGGLRMGFRYLGEGQAVAEGRSSLVLSLGTDVRAEELMGLDKIDVDVSLGFAMDME